MSAIYLLVSEVKGTIRQDGEKQTDVLFEQFRPFPEFWSLLSFLVENRRKLKRSEKH